MTFVAAVPHFVTMAAYAKKLIIQKDTFVYVNKDTVETSVKKRDLLAKKVRVGMEHVLTRFQGLNANAHLVKLENIVRKIKTF